MSGIVLLRLDFYTRPEMVGLIPNQKHVLTILHVHPWARADGILCFSKAAHRASGSGLDYDAVLAALPELEELGFIVFDKGTLEVWPVDFFEINQAPGQGKNMQFAAGQAVAFRTCVSKKVIGEWRHRADEAPSEKLVSVAVPSNYLSCLSGSSSKRLMPELLTAAVALMCHPAVSAAGAGKLDLHLLASMLGFDLPTAEGAKNLLISKGIVYFDNRTSEYWFKKWLSIPGKLNSAGKIDGVVRASKDLESGYIRRMILNAVRRICGDSIDHLLKSSWQLLESSPELFESLKKLPQGFIDKSEASETPDFTQPTFTLPTPTQQALKSGEGDQYKKGKVKSAELELEPTADEVVQAIMHDYEQSGRMFGGGLEHTVRKRWSGGRSGANHRQADLIAVGRYREYQKRIRDSQSSLAEARRPAGKMTREEQELVRKAFINKTGQIIQVNRVGAKIAGEFVPLSTVLKMVKSGVLTEVNEERVAASCS